MTGGFASVAGSTLVGYALLGAPLSYLLATTVMNAPASLYIAKMMLPDTEESSSDESVRDVCDTESANVIDATARGALAGGRIAVIVGCLLIAFIAHRPGQRPAERCHGEWFDYDGLTFEGCWAGSSPPWPG